ncbi:acyl-CoA carboxylase epsilon subunit [Frigoribacterium sp. PhB24]|uniref:acyl-CoA carboxylase epsilon subunit n=1 Tax=Frigoribacterium sp. PhB24 TaxID=2485204 RepID=UPI000F4AE36F|nr:acyl-CoA carboxylase epsilon subunit [Frigoribacterium sp. PhB24]ROS53010.1 acyl-CoA carboxylase epsilon subunit-like protein [Frigoribacterium sp. PhB24]
MVEPTAAPLLRVVAGAPTSDELAAVTALLAAVEAGRAESAGTTSRPTSSAWTRSARAPRPMVVAGDGQWRGFAG